MFHLFGSRIFNFQFFNVFFFNMNESSVVTEREPELWEVEPSKASWNCCDSIGDINASSVNFKPNPEKAVIVLSVGDPTLYGNLKAAEETVQAVRDALDRYAHNGYASSRGTAAARLAVADYLTHDGVRILPEDVIVCSGCSSSLEHCIVALADGSKSDNILLPRPGFHLYPKLANHIGVQVRYYNLLPEKNCEVDLDHLESLIDQNTAALVINNPSNPCGSNYSKNHLESLLQIAHRHRLPIIADEIYENIVFPGQKFISMASLDSGVPILICGGLAKRFLVPGWRLGWIAVHDPVGAFERIRKVLIDLNQKTLGSNTLVQGALPAILKNTPQSAFDSLCEFLCSNAKVAFKGLQNAEGLKPFMPQGGMFMLVKIHLDKFPMFRSDLEFTRKLMEEESVLCRPGEAFAAPGFMRIVLTTPMMEEACLRICEFCIRYFIK